DEEPAELVVADRALVLVGVVAVRPRGAVLTVQACRKAWDDAHVALLRRAALRPLAARLALFAAEQDALLRLHRELGPCGVRVDGERLDRASELRRERDRTAASPRQHDAFTEGARRVADHALRVDDRAGSEAVARGARPVRAVEREHARL